MRCSTSNIHPLRCGSGCISKVMSRPSIDTTLKRAAQVIGRLCGGGRCRSGWWWCRLGSCWGSCGVVGGNFFWCVWPMYLGAGGCFGYFCAHLFTFDLTGLVDLWLDFCIDIRHQRPSGSIARQLASIGGKAVPNSRRATGGQTPGPRGRYVGPGESPTIPQRRVRPTRLHRWHRLTRRENHQMDQGQSSL